MYSLNTNVRIIQHALKLIKKVERIESLKTKWKLASKLTPYWALLTLTDTVGHYVRPLIDILTLAQYKSDLLFDFTRI